MPARRRSGFRYPALIITGVFLCLCVYLSLPCVVLLLVVAVYVLVVLFSMWWGSVP